MTRIVNVCHSPNRHHYAALQVRSLCPEVKQPTEIKMQKQTFFMLVLLGLIVISQVDAITSGGLQMFGKRGLQVRMLILFKCISLFPLFCFVDVCFNVACVIL